MYDLFHAITLAKRQIDNDTPCQDLNGDTSDAKLRIVVASRRYIHCMYLLDSTYLSIEAKVLGIMSVVIYIHMHTVQC